MDKKLEKYQVSFDELFSFNNLYKSGKECCKGTRWKSSVGFFEIFLLTHIYKIKQNLYSEKRVFNGFETFLLTDANKQREISALNINDRCAHKNLCKFYLNDLLNHRFVYENAASTKNKGFHFSVKRLRQQLAKHFRKYQLSGGILQFDLKNYFASIPHNELKERLKPLIKDEQIYSLVCWYIDNFRYVGSLLKKFQKQNIDLEDVKEFKGLGLGSEVSQILALEYMNPLDHFIKDHLRIKGYGRYNDDFYIIGHDLKELKNIYLQIKNFAENKLKIKLNEKKTKITPFKSHSFTFLKKRFTLLKTGKILTKLSRESSKATRRKLKKFRRWMDKGLFTIENVIMSYQSWRSYALDCNSYKTVQSMDKLFVRLYRNELATYRLKVKLTVKCEKINNKFIYYC